jgi:hypothetical protein
MELAGMPDTRREALRIVEKDGRRVQRLAIITILLWLLVTAVIAFVLFAYTLLYLPRQTQILQNLGARGDNVLGEIDLPHLIPIVSRGTAIVAGSVGLLALATLITVALVLAARRATLRQVNSSLLEISEQLKALRQALAKPNAGGA